MLFKYLIKIKEKVCLISIVTLFVLNLNFVFAEKLFTSNHLNQPNEYFYNRNLFNATNTSKSHASSFSILIEMDKCANFNVSSDKIDNETLECRKEMIENRLGPRTKSLDFIIIMTIVYVLILVCGMIGNISTCYVIISNSCMHTTTNYYLFSLAVSDVLSLMSGLPTELYSIIVESYPWAHGETFCLIRTFIFEITTIASVLTILTFTFERWLHICKPMYAQKFSSGFSRALKIILFIWFFSGTISLPYLFTTGVFNEIPSFPETKTCSTLEKYRDVMKTMIQLSVLFLFIVPMTLISIMYVFIGVTLWKSSKSHKFHGGPKLRRCLKSDYIQKCDPNSTNALKLSKAQYIKRDGSLPVLIHYSTNNKKKLKHTYSDQNPTANTINTCERTSKDFDNIAYKNRQSRRDVVKMLLLGFFTCWAPFHAQRVLAIYTNHDSKSVFMIKLLELTFYVSGISIYISSTLNPILYNVMSKRYRTAFKNTLQMIVSCKKPSQPFKGQTYYSNYYNTLNKGTIHSRNLQNNKNMI